MDENIKHRAHWFSTVKSSVRLVKKSLKHTLKMAGTIVSKQRQFHRVKDKIRSLKNAHKNAVKELHNWQAAYRNAENQIASWRKVYKEAESHIEIYKREIAYWQSRCKPDASPSQLQDMTHKKTVEFHAKTISHLVKTQTDLFINKTSDEKISWPMFSIIMPVWNRENFIGEAIASVSSQHYPFWELLIIDDGSTDKTRQMIEPYLSDPRIQYHYQEHSGVGAARNAGLHISKGDFIAYLDSDNTWFPETLAITANYLVSYPQCQMAYFAEIWHEAASGNKWINFPEQLNYDDTIFQEKNYELFCIDMNTFIHTRALYDQLGGFDVNLTRMEDYELIYRYHRHAAIKAFPFIGGHYNYGKASNTLTGNENYWYNLHLMRKKHYTPTQTAPLRVLYLLDSDSRSTEPHILTEIEYMQRQGVAIEIWSENQACTLTDAIRKAKPDLIHACHRNCLKFASDIENAGLRITIRGHDFTWLPDELNMLQQHKAVHAVYLFPHSYKHINAKLDKVKPVMPCFNPERIFPAKTKNRKLVLTVAAASPVNDMEPFFRIARRCTEHQFVLVVDRSKSEKQPDDMNELVKYNQQHGNSVDLRVNATQEEVLSLIEEAGIYFHMHALIDDKIGPGYDMPASIAEAMATGAYIIGYECQALKDYIGNAGDCYVMEIEAIDFINATLQWQKAEWHSRQKRSIDMAYLYNVDYRVLTPIYRDWLTLSGII